MYIPMLEAVSEMLAEDKDGVTNQERVFCAKTMLDKIIEGMKDKLLPPSELAVMPYTGTGTPPPQAQPATLEVKPKRTGVEPEVEYDNVKKVFTRVTNIPADGMIEINGYRIKADTIIGKSVKEIPLLGEKVDK